MGGEGVHCVGSPTKHFVHELIDWDRVEERLRCYPAISRSFPQSTLKKYSDKPPYYCHYMAWRLGTWVTESHFENLEMLLHRAKSLPNWENESPLLTGGGYGDFWSLVWQLQVAEYLHARGKDVMWGARHGGPDLSVEIDGCRWFVECYVPRKRYGLLEFVNDILPRIDSRIKTRYNPYLPLRLPVQDRIGEWLDSVVLPLCSSAYLDDMASQASERGYAVIHRCVVPYPLHIYMEGENAWEHVPPWRDVVGEPSHHVRVILYEAVANKAEKNQLAAHRPNILAVNLFLTDAPRAESLRSDVIVNTAPSLTGFPIDILAVTAQVGIGEPIADFMIAACLSEELRSEAMAWMERA